MKRFYFYFTAFCVLFGMICGCSFDGVGSPSLQPPGNETGTVITDPEPEDEEEQIVSVPQADNEDEETEEIAIEPAQAEFLGTNIISGTKLEFVFSSPVTVLSLSLNPHVEVSSVEGGSKVTVILEEALTPGTQFEADLEAEDEWENTINTQISFISKNDRVPKLLINELRTEYSKPKAEFIEFRVLSNGNLGALRVFAAGNKTDSMIYQFKPVEVLSGDYVVLHLRTLEDSCKDEYGEALDESKGTDSCDSARDFWIPDSKKLLRKTDAIYVLDQDERVLDAVMISEAPDSAWKKDYLAEAAEFLFTKGAWKSPGGGICRPADAIDSSGIKTSLTRSISRKEAKENTGSAADWYITATGGVSPGSANKP